MYVSAYSCTSSLAFIMVTEGQFSTHFAGQDLLETFNGTERISYISADIEEWNYIPTNTDQCSGETFDEDTVSHSSLYAAAAAGLPTQAPSKLML
jgi:hypothetical protein